jgi:NAD+ synthase
VNCTAIETHIVDWLNQYLERSSLNGFIIGVSGGVDSAVCSTLCALTGKKVYLLNMPIRQQSVEFDRAKSHIHDLEKRFSNVIGFDIPLTTVFNTFEEAMPNYTKENDLAMANSRSRLRMMTLYAIGQATRSLVVGTGNKIEDFGVGFFTKYGDGGVDLSPIADLTKTEVFELAAHLNVVEAIQTAKPTDGLWGDGRTDEDQLGATYPELEWAMDFKGDETYVSERQKEVLSIYKKFHRINHHKMVPIPLCEIPKKYKL